VVIDERGEPRTDIPVQAAPRSGPAAGSGTVGARTDDQGRFRIDAAPGEWNLWANAEGNVDTPWYTHTLHAGENAPAVIQLHRTFSVEGLVSDRNGEPVPGAHVAAVPAAPPWTGAVERWEGLPISLRSNLVGQAVATRADELGRYQLVALPPGPLVVLATRAPLNLGPRGQPGSVPEPLPRDAVLVDLGADDSAQDSADDSADDRPEDSLADLTLDLTVVEGGVVRGRITHRGGPAAGVRVGVVARREGPARWALAAETTTDDDGSYRLAGLLPGRAVLVVRPTAGYPALRPVELQDIDDLVEDVDLAGLTVRGRVIDASTREPLAGAEVVCGPFAPQGWDWPLFERLDEATLGRLHHEILGDFSAAFTTGPDGRFELVNLPAATLWHAADLSGYLPAWKPDGTHTQADLELILELAPAAVLSGAVHGDTSGFEGGLLVELIERASGRRAARDSPYEGGWTLDPVEPGAYELRLVTRADPPRVLQRELIVVKAGDRLSFEWELD